MGQIFINILQTGTYVISHSSINVLIPHTFFFNERDILTVFIGTGGFDHPPQAQ
jgi:hypothetical protein